MLSVLLSLLLSSAPGSAPPPAAPSSAAPAPKVTLEVARHCTAPAEGLPFLVSSKTQEGPACFLDLYTPPPRSAEDSARWGPAIPRIYADPNGLAESCAEMGYGEAKAPSQKDPQMLYIRVSGAERVEIDSRPLKGHIEENNFLSEGWGEWTQVYASPVSAGQVLQVPIAKLNSGAITLFELRIRAGDQVQQFGVSIPALC